MTRILASAAVLAALVACGGDTPAPAPPAPTKAAPKPVPPKKEAPKVDPMAEFNKLDDAAKGDKLMALGKTVYETGGSGGLACKTCHQDNGEGLPPSFPPLKGQKTWMGSCENHAGYVVHGLQGEIEVDGVRYNGVMPSQGNLTDLEIAAVISYERMSWGNDFGLCMPEVVAAARAKK